MKRYHSPHLCSALLASTVLTVCTTTKADFGQADDSGPASIPKAGISLVAGKIGGAGKVDGSVTAARFNDPHGVAVDAAGNVYVVDLDDVEAVGIKARGRNVGIGSVRKISPAGMVTTLARAEWVSGRTSIGCTVDFVGGRRGYAWSQRGVAVDSKGNLYVGDLAGGAIRKIEPNGTVTKLTISTGDIATEIHFEFPDGVAVDDSDNVYVADRAANTINKISPDGVLTALAGAAGMRGATDGIGASARFNGPDGLAVDGNGNIFVADSGNRAIRKVSSTGEVTTLARGFAMPLSVAVDGKGNVYVADSEKGNISKIFPSGEVTILAGTGKTDGIALGDLSKPISLAIDSAGSLYVSSRSAILKMRLP